MATLKKAGLPALVLAAAMLLLVFGTLIGCPQEEEEDIPSKEGVLTVNGADDGVYYEADVYDYSDAVIDAAQLNSIISILVPTGTGLGIAGNGTLELNLKKADGTAFKSDGDFLAVLKATENAGVSVRYMAYVPFTAGSATLEYANMDTALVGPDDPGVSSYTVTFDLNYTGAPNPPEEQEIDEGGKVTPPADPQRTGYTFGGWYEDKALDTPCDFDREVTADIHLYAKWLLPSFAAIIADMAANNGTAAKEYKLASADEAYSAAVTLTTANSPASVTIDGGNRVITGNANRITVGSGVTLTLKNITFTKIPFTVEAGGKLMLETGSLVTGNEEGAAITVNSDSAALNGTLVMKEGASVSNNGKADTSSCGILLTGSGSTFIMDGGKVSGNVGRDSGAGVAVYSTGSTFTMNGGEISGNTAGLSAGGVLFWANQHSTFNMTGGTIKNNSAGIEGGGGVDIWPTNTFNMAGGEITGNTTVGNGGGVYLDNIGTINGYPQIGGTTPPGAGKGWIHGNTPDNVGSPASFATLVKRMTANVASLSYTLPNGEENYTDALTLTTANSPASVTIDGGGRVITGNANRFTIGSSVTLTLKNITFTKIPFTVEAGGKLVLDNAIGRENEGAGVTVSGGTLEMKEGSSITQNRTSGVVVQTNGMFTMDGSTISGNDGFGVTISGGTLEMKAGAVVRENAGGGVTVSGDSMSAKGTLVMKDGASVSNNGKAATSSCGILLTGSGSTFIMDGGKVSGNAGRGSGAGVCVYSANSTFTMNGGEISGNNAGQRAGGVLFWANQHSTFNMNGGTIKNNSAGIEGGGGVTVMATNTFNMTGGEITVNTAVGNGGGVFMEGGTLTGNLSIGSKVNGKGSIYSNTPNDLYPAQ